MLLKKNNSNASIDEKINNDLSVRILSADGMYSLVDKEVCKLLFYTKVPFIDVDEHDHEFISQREELQIEVRLPMRGLQSMIETLVEELEALVEEKEKQRLHSSEKNDQIQSVEVI